MTRRVLNVIESLGLGGAERLLLTTHRHIDRRLVEPEVACLFGPNPLAEELRSAGVRVHELGLRSPRDVPDGVLRLRRLMGDARFDVVHTHLYYANLAGRLAAWGRARVVSTLHNPDYTYESRPGAVFAAKKLADRFTGRWMTRRLVAVSDEVRRDFEKQLGFSGIEVIPNYIDLDRFTRRLDQVDRATARARCGVGPDDVMVLHVGRLHPQKGQDLLIDAIARARRDVPRLVLFLVGEGGSRAALEGRARDRGIGAEVRFERAQREVSVYYRAADMFAFPGTRRSASRSWRRWPRVFRSWPRGREAFRTSPATWRPCSSRSATSTRCRMASGGSRATRSGVVRWEAPVGSGPRRST